MTPLAVVPAVEVGRASGAINSKVLAFGPLAAVATVLASMWFGVTAWSGTVPPSAIVIALVALVLGIPHGAVDHLTLTQGLSMSSRLVRAVSYSLVAAASTALILVAPAALFVVVLAMSVWHFGTGDVEATADLGGAVRHGDRVRRLQVLAAGSAPVLLPLTSSSAISTLGLIQPRLAVVFTPVVTASVRMAVLAVIAVTLTVLAQRRDWHSAGELAVLTILGIVATPLVAFGVYFATSHALRHTARLAQGELGDVRWTALVRVFMVGLPALVVTSLIVIVCAKYFGGATLLGTWLWFGLAIVWGLTVPHMVVISRFDRSRREHT